MEKNCFLTSNFDQLDIPDDSLFLAYFNDCCETSPMEPFSSNALKLRSSSSSSSSTASISSTTVKRGKKKPKPIKPTSSKDLKLKLVKNRKVNPAYVPELRIIKNDIRRKYSEMYCNVRNSHDTLLLQHFLFQFCLPTCEYVLNFSKVIEGRQPMKKLGIPTIFLKMLDFQLRFPDFINSLTNVQIIVSYDNYHQESKIIGTEIFKGTRLYDYFIPPNQRFLSLEEVLFPENQHSLLSSQEEHENNQQQSYQQQQEENDLFLSILKEICFPRYELCISNRLAELEFQSTFTLVLDEHHRIKQFKTEVEQLIQNQINPSAVCK